MNRIRLVFYSAFGTYHLGAFVFTIMLDNDTGLLFKMVSYVPMFKWITLLGLMMIIADVLWSFMLDRSAARDNAALTQQLNTLKAKLFDLQEEGKKQTSDTKK